MRVAGIDVGSRTVKAVVLEDGDVLLSRRADTSYEPLAVCRELLGDVPFDRLVATGYGRHIVRELYGCAVITEIRAFALGARALFPECRAVLDIGGQDTKVISLDENGRILRFEMNDRCAAGTGRFLEIMASALRYPVPGFGSAALEAAKAEKISSMCTVFAESEVISLITRGARREEVALGIHEAIGQRVLSMLGRMPSLQGLVFAGGVAHNACIRSLVTQSVGIPPVVPADPQMVGALGAALEGLCGDGMRPIAAAARESHLSSS
jgi:predicted CoA-substrate-specific enzyme activase